MNAFYAVFCVSSFLNDATCMRSCEMRVSERDTRNLHWCGLTGERKSWMTHGDLLEVWNKKKVWRVKVGWKPALRDGCCMYMCIECPFLVFPLYFIYAHFFHLRKFFLCRMYNMELFLIVFPFNWYDTMFSAL